MRIEVKRKTVEARCRSDTVEKEDGKLGQSFCIKIYAEICTVTKIHGIMSGSEWNMLTHSACAKG